MKLSYIPEKVSGLWSYVWFLKLQLRTSQWRMILFHNRDTWEGERAAWGTKQLNLLKVELLPLLVKPHWLWPITIYTNKETISSARGWEQLKCPSIKHKLIKNLKRQLLKILYFYLRKSLNQYHLYERLDHPKIITFVIYSPWCCSKQNTN